MVQDASLQIFLTLYHGQLLSTLFYDLILRNSMRLFYYEVQWNMVANIAIGLFFSLFVIWFVVFRVFDINCQVWRYFAVWKGGDFGVEQDSNEFGRYSRRSDHHVFCETRCGHTVSHGSTQRVRRQDLCRRSRRFQFSNGHPFSGSLDNMGFGFEANICRLDFFKQWNWIWNKINKWWNTNSRSFYFEQLHFASIINTGSLNQKDFLASIMIFDSFKLQTKRLDRTIFK